MDNDVKKLMADVLLCITNIENYLGTQPVFEQYESNQMLQDAVERNLITIGEAVNVLSKKKEGIGISDARKIVDLRNRLTHGYDAVDPFMIWVMLIKHLPILKQEAIKILGK